MTTLYLKYRPQTLDELDLTDVRVTLKKIVKSGKIPHALLFYGPKGSGKTSAARIIAKIVNCEKHLISGEPCNKCEQCISISKGSNIDVIELDAASHRGIDDIRMIKDAVKLSPAKAKKKVYIIDEAHMLTTEASNALLKTLEEPPEHVLFILATTNPEKLIDTIRSRTVNINFAKARDEEIIRAIMKTLKGEKIKAGEKSLKLIAKASDGSFREAHKIIENLISQGSTFGEEELEKQLFEKTTVSSLEKIIDGLSEHDAGSVIKEIEKVVNTGGKVELLVIKLIDRFIDALFSKMDLPGNDLKMFSKMDLTDLIKLLNTSYGEIPKSYLEQIPLELAVIRWCEKKQKEDNLRQNGEDEVSKKKEAKKESHINIKKETVNIKTKGKDTRKIDLDLTSETGCISDEIWKKILSDIKPKNTSTEALLRASKPISFDGKTLTLGVFYSFHKEKLEEHYHKHLLEEVAASVIGRTVKIECTLSQPPVRTVSVETNPEKEESPSDVISTPSDSFLTDADDEDIIKVAKEVFGG
jgi:DNA polymerase-3 subunit gamma/tau